MSAALCLLPPTHGILRRVHAVASSAAVPSVARAAAAVTERKAPHRLHLVRAAAAPAAATAQTWRPAPALRSPEANLAFYRKYTEGLLRRYSRMVMDSGRTPSLLGRELFPGHVSGYKVQGFDDQVIFVHDVGACIATLEPGRRYLVRRIALEEYTHEETAALLGITLRTVRRRYADAIDLLTRLLLDRRLMQPLDPGREVS